MKPKKVLSFSETIQRSLDKANARREKNRAAMNLCLEHRKAWEKNQAPPGLAPQEAPAPEARRHQATLQLKGQLDLL